VTSHAQQRLAAFDPAAFEEFRFVEAQLSDAGVVELRYALDDTLAFVERVELPVSAPLTAEQRASVSGLLSCLHLAAGVSYFKTAAPSAISLGEIRIGPAASRLFEALYSEGLAEFAYRNDLAHLPRPQFLASDHNTADGVVQPVTALDAQDDRTRTLVPVGGGKDSIVALEAIRASGRPFALFSVGDAAPISRTAAVAGMPRLVARRIIDPAVVDLNARGALNGHVPVTAIVSLIALLAAKLNGFGAVAMANERSASSGNVQWDGVEVNHQFSKGLRVETMLREALVEIDAGVEYFSVLRPVSELAITKAFAALPQYHAAFTSCNAVFRLDRDRRAESWCGDCPKCRFVYVALAPFSDPGHLREIFGSDLLDDASQYEGFALLAATGGHKPFECVGEERETVAAFRMLAADPRWRDHRIVRRFVDEVLDGLPATVGDPASELALAGTHHLPDDVLTGLHAVLGA
jgi:hypothetical protein